MLVRTRGRRQSDSGAVVNLVLAESETPFGGRRTVRSGLHACS